mgnify:CR=1 FL=1
MPLKLKRKTKTDIGLYCRKMFRVFGVIPAAGSGQRMNLYPAKQFQLIEDKPVLSYTIDAFERCVDL